MVLSGECPQDRSTFTASGILDMSPLVLEERVEALEHELAELRREVRTAGRTGDWRETIGMFDDDPGILEVHRLGQEYRQRDRDHTQQ